VRGSSGELFSGEGFGHPLRSGAMKPVTKGDAATTGSGTTVDGRVVYLGLGSNLGDRAARLAAAAKRLAADGVVRDVVLSPIYETDAVSDEPQPPYLNAVARGVTGLGAAEVLAGCLRVEAALGRVRPEGVDKAARSIDIDLLLHGDSIIQNGPALVVPHPGLLGRPFVRVPLADVARPGLVHPVTGEALDVAAPSPSVRWFAAAAASGKPAASRRLRADLALLEQGLAPSREKARALILAGEVLAGDRPIDKAGDLVASDAPLRLRSAPMPFVSRGGLKLAHALSTFGIDVAGRVALDVGASTGGFTDCLLQRGAARVFCVDVGYGQLDAKIAGDPRVVVLDRTNIRNAAPDLLPQPAELGVIDVSFISLGLVLPALRGLLGPGAPLVALVKPQFEVGRAHIGKGGIVRDEAARRHAVADVTEKARALGYAVRGETTSPITGGKGNVEYLLHLTAPG
jgi:23S rRNA (cytidine1920-2'-O)/16S rRNA (cytidine1409-2'-O)-methyltransferase